MKVHLHFYAQLRDLVGTSRLDVDLSESATVAELMEKLYQLKPTLRAHDKNILIASGVEFVGRDRALHEREEIAIMPPVQGG